MYLKYLNSKKFVDNTNLFFSYKRIKELFHTINLELNKICAWSNANKLFLNKDKTKYKLLRKVQETDIIFY